MDKQLISILLPVACCLALCLKAEPIPTGYYNIAQGKADAELKTALHDTIQGGLRFHYGTWGYRYDTVTHRQTDERYEGTWSYFALADRHSNGTIWDMYSPYVRYFPAFGESGCSLQIEHCVPKSWWGDEAGCKRAYQDLYNLNPSDAAANNNKSNYPPGIVIKGDKFDNGVFKMDSKSKSQYGWACYEPADTYKGDFARTYFYIATAYEDIPWVYGTSPFAAENAVTNESYLEFQPWLIDLLLEWHRQDPVSRKEVERLDAISSVQHNRNPYIDYPELVEYIWGDKKGQTVDFGQLVCTSSDDYHPSEDNTDLRLYADATLNELDLTWNDCQTSYFVDVYTQSVIGRNDTLINLNGVTKKMVEATGHGAIQGKTVANGTQSLTLGSGSTDATVVLYGLQSLVKNDKPLTLRFRVSLYNTASSGQLDVYADKERIQSVTDLSHDEEWLEFTLPQNTDSVRLASVGGNTSKRVCLQAVFVIQGDETMLHQSLEGYPKQTEFNQIQVRVPSDIDTIYAQVSTAAGMLSNERLINLSQHPSALHPTRSNKQAVKFLYNGQIYICVDSTIYYPLSY